MRFAYQAWQAGELAVLHERLIRYLPQPHEEDLRGFEWYYLWRLDQRNSPLTIDAGQREILAAVFAPDGRTLAIADIRSGRIGMLQTATGHSPTVISGNRGVIQCMAFAPDGKTLAIVWADETVRLLDLTAWRLRSPLGQPANSVEALAFSTDGMTLVAGCDLPPVDYQTFLFGINYKGLVTGPREDVRRWDVASGKELPALPGQEPWGASALAFAAGGRTLAAGDSRGLVWRWDLPSGQPLPPLAASMEAGRSWRTWELARKNSLPMHPEWLDKVRACAYSPVGRMMAAASDRGTVRRWDVATGQERGLRLAGPGEVGCLAFAPDGQTLATGQGTDVQFWDVNTGEAKQTLRGHRGQVCCLAFSPDGTRLATAGDDHGILLWDLQRSGNIKLVGHTDRVASLAFAPDGQTLASGSWDQTVRLWHVPTARLMMTLEGQPAACMPWPSRRKGRIWPAAAKGPEGPGRFTFGRRQELSAIRLIDRPGSVK